MKKLILVLSILVSIASGSFAQNNQQKTPEQRATMHVQRMKKELLITQEQADKAYPILVENAKKLDAIRDENKEDAKRKEEVEKQKAATDLKLKEILTAEQYKKYEARKDQKEANKEKRAEAKKEATKK